MYSEKGKKEKKKQIFPSGSRVANSIFFRDPLQSLFRAEFASPWRSDIKALHHRKALAR
jgi:hypothetical protein